MRIYHLGACLMICFSLSVGIGYTSGKVEMGAFIGFVLGMIPIVIYRRTIKNREKRISENEKTFHT